VQQLSDEQLINAYFNGGTETMEELVRRYLKPIYKFVCRVLGSAADADDVTQEVFIKTWRQLKKFDQTKSFKPWIFTIAKNSCLDFLKKKRAIPFSEFENETGENLLTETLIDESPLPPELFERQEIIAHVLAALDKLTPAHKMVVLLHYHHNFTFEEIAVTLDAPMNTVKSRYRRALIKLRELLIAPK